MIVGCGIDIVEIERIKNLRKRYQGRFLNRLFSEREKEYCRKKKWIDEHLAGRLAAKEAFMKALGERISQLGWHDVEIVNNKEGKPEIFLLGKARVVITNLQIMNIFLSISHSDTNAIAQVILER